MGVACASHEEWPKRCPPDWDSVTRTALGAPVSGAFSIKVLKYYIFNSVSQFLQRQPVPEDSTWQPMLFFLKSVGYPFSQISFEFGHFSLFSLNAVSKMHNLHYFRTILVEIENFHRLRNHILSGAKFSSCSKQWISGQNSWNISPPK